MKDRPFTEEFLRQIRASLPSGGIRLIAKLLSTPESPLSPDEVRRVLHGAKLRYGKPSVHNIIATAEGIIDGTINPNKPVINAEIL